MNPRRAVSPWQNDHYLRVTKASMKAALGLASEEDAEALQVTPRLSHQGVFAAEGEETKKRFAFSKRM